MKNLWNQDLFMDAWHFASHRHKGQTYGGEKKGEQIEYLNHLTAVVMEVTNCLYQTDITYDADLAILCAILHDTMEDTNTAYVEIEKLFGTKTADGVLALTKNTALSSKTEQMKDSLQRILMQGPEIAVVKLSDRITNLYRPPFYWTKEKITAYREEAVLICDTLKGSDPILVNRLRTKIQLYTAYEK